MQMQMQEAYLFLWSYNTEGSRFRLKKVESTHQPTRTHLFLLKHNLCWGNTHANRNKGHA